MDEVDQSVETTDTSVSEESESRPESSEAPEQVAQAETESKEEKLPPFHEHPRFKELIDQNRGYKSELDEYKGALERLKHEMESLRQQSAPKKEQPADPFLADLEKVNPEYAKSLKAVYEQAAMTRQLQERIDRYEQQQFAEKAYSHFNKLLSDAKVNDGIDREIYESAIKAQVFTLEQQGKRLGLQDLDKLFNEFHSKYSKAMEERNRKLTAQYVQQKATDKAPKATTGGAPATSSTKKIAAGDIQGQAKWLADQIRQMKKTI